MSDLVIIVSDESVGISVYLDNIIYHTSLPTSNFEYSFNNWVIDNDINMSNVSIIISEDINGVSDIIITKIFHSLTRLSKHIYFTSKSHMLNDLYNKYGSVVNNMSVICEDLGFNIYTNEESFAILASISKEIIYDYVKDLEKDDIDEIFVTYQT